MAAMMVAVDMVLGPLLTAIVYRQDKGGLAVDLAVIFIVQLTAFGYGMYAMSVARPAWIVFTGYRFDLVQANGLDTRFINEAPMGYRSPPWWGAQWVAAQPPSDIQKNNQLVFESFGGGADMSQRPDLYVPIEKERQRLKEKAQPLERLADFNGAYALADVRRRWPDADGFFPLLAKHRLMTVLVNRRTSAIVGIVDLKPFESSVRPASGSERPAPLIQVRP